MRSFEERMAEIGRRSEEIKKARKATRKRLLMACIPLVLCIGVYAVLGMGLSGNTGGDPILLPENAPDGAAMGTLNGSGDVAYTRLDIRTSSVIADGTEETISDISRVCAVYDILVERYRGSIISESMTEDKESEVSSSDTPKDNAAPVKEYTFTFSTPGGAEAIFRLQGNCLTDLATGESYILSQEQLDRLWEALGLTGGA